MTTGIYVGGFPSAKFGFPRSYAAQFNIYATTTDIDQFGDTFTVWINRTIGYGITFILQPYVLPWSSNYYTLDFLVYDLWWHAFFDGVHHPDTYSMAFTWLGSPARPTITIALSIGGSIENISQLPPAPPTYWYPHYL